MKFYISGKIGEDKPSPETLAKFKKAEDMLRAKGHEVFNPTTSGLGAHAESLAKANDTSFYEEILTLDLMALKKCDAVLALPDWNISHGAQSELIWAKALKKPIYREGKNGGLIFFDVNVVNTTDFTVHMRAFGVSLRSFDEYINSIGLCYPYNMEISVEQCILDPT